MQKIIKYVAAFLFIVFSFPLAQANSTLAFADDNKIIATYFGIWTETRDNGPDQQWSQKLNDTTPLDKVNRVYIAFANPHLKSDDQSDYDLQWYLPDKNGNQQTQLADFRVNDLVTRIKNAHPNDTPGIFVVIGEGVTGGQGASLKDVAADSDFPKAVIQFLKKYDLNGVDIDWESDIKDNLTNLLKNLQKIRQSGYYLTLDVIHNASTAYDPSITEYVDQINIMSYGTTLNHLDEYISEFENKPGFDPSQIIGGVETESDYQDHDARVDTLGANGTIQEKTKEAINMNIAGMMSWRLGNDYAPSTDKNTPTYKGAVCLYQAMTSKEGCQ